VWGTLAYATRGMGRILQHKCKRYTSSERGMVNLFEFVIYALSEACNMPEGLLRKSRAGSNLAIINTVHKYYCSKLIYKRNNTVLVSSR